VELVKLETAMKALVAVQESIEITSPRIMKVQKAWLSAPPQSQSLVAQLPAFTNSWDFVQETRNSVLRRMTYLVNMRLHVAQATEGDNELAAELALAFLDPILTAFDKKNTITGLGGMTLAGVSEGVIAPTVTYQNIRGGSPTLAIFGENVRTIGLDLLMEMELNDAVEFS
jgi:uncharacterized membrane protein YdfJ with MMPL/SSD domain